MTSIFVAKLDFNTTDEQLKSLFERYGKVNRVTIAKDRETGKPRGFAFVEMFNEQEAEAAISALDNSAVNGRTIAVKKADDRGSKPQEGNNSSFNRNEQRPPRQDFKSATSEKPAFRKQEDFPKSPSQEPGDVIPIPVKTERKKEKPKDNFDSKDRPKQQKMAAYKKSGKSNRFFDDDDDDLDDWTSSRRNSNGWDEEE